MSNLLKVKSIQPAGVIDIPFVALVSFHIDIPFVALETERKREREREREMPQSEQNIAASHS